MKSKYEEYVQPRLTEIECWCRDGLIDEEIAKRLGVGYSTFKNYKTEHQDLLDALKNGKAIIDYSVENSLLKRAQGFEYTEKTKELIKGVLVVTKEVTKIIAPDPTSCIFWLKNRKPEYWKDRKELDLNVTGLPERMKKAEEKLNARKTEK